MTRRKQNCPKRMKWEGGEGEEPPEGIHKENDDEDEQEDDEAAEDEDADGASSGDNSHSFVEESNEAISTQIATEDDLPTPQSPMNEEQQSADPVIAKEDIEENPEEKCTTEIPSPLSATPPPPILERCSSRESLGSLNADQVSEFHTAPSRSAGTGAGMSSTSPHLSSSCCSSPPLLHPAASSPPLKISMEVDDDTVLDFSTTKRSVSRSPSPVLNLSKSVSPHDVAALTNGPLDLSVGNNRKREHHGNGVPSSPAKKPHRIPPPVSPISPWSSPLLTYQLPYFSSSSVPIAPHLKNNHHLDSSLWNGKAAKIADKSNFGIPLNPTESAKALEKMSELSKLNNDEFRPVTSSGSSGRHSAWQSHWLNKGADQAKDVLKCVWCKQSFPSLAALTTHMQEAKHCGVNVPPGVSHGVSHGSTSAAPPTTSQSSIHSSPSASSGKSSSSDLNLLIKETMPLPRKLVRGQDVWLGKGAEQTRQILKCMWCGQSFRSLAEMTSHMQQTQHYTNIISQEQIISWKSAEEGKSSSTSSSNAQSSGNPGGTSGSSTTSNSHVSAVLTCKVCDQAFTSLKELSNHMVKNAHYKEHIMRSITESGGRRRQTREKRKKSLPVRKLLELERAQNELKNGDNMMMMMMMGKSAGGLHGSGNRIPCEKCGEKIDIALFVDHIRMCMGSSGSGLADDKKNLLKSALLSCNNMNNLDYVGGVGGGVDIGKLNKESSTRHTRSSPSRASDLSTSSSKGDGGKSSSPSVLNAIEKLIEKSFDPRTRHGVANYPGGVGGGHGNGNSPVGSSILKRLGIDESVDYTKPLMDASLQAAKAYMFGNSSAFYNSQLHDQNYFGSRRERSGSESSSVSERGSSRHDSLTPDRKCDSSDRLMASSTPRTTPEKRGVSISPNSVAKIRTYESPEKELLLANIKKEREDPAELLLANIKKEREDPADESAVKKGCNVDYGEGEDRKDISRRSSRSREPSITPNGSPEPVGEDLSTSSRSRRIQSSPSSALSPEGDRISPSTAGSPSNSERSVTPRSCTDSKKTSGSLGALSSMFDSLSSSNAPGSSSDNAPSQGSKSSSHPLAALQKLCDKTETHGHGSRSSGGANRSPNSTASGGAGTPQPATSPGAILAFSWACNDAVITDSIMKCAFCDTPFISKGAYRHHLSKMHFVKDGVMPEPVPLKSPPTPQGSSLLPRGKSPNNNNNNNNSNNNNNNNGNSNKDQENNNKIKSSSSGSIKSPPASNNNFDESPHSKFLKYTELAKQLSSKYM